MNSKERIKKIINFEKPDKIPIDYWSTNEMTKKLIKFYKVKNKSELLDKLDVDLRYIEGPEYNGPSLKKKEDGSFEDMWGVWRKKIATPSGAIYKNVVHHPLEKINTLKDVEAYSKWPSPDWFDYSKVLDQLKRYPNRATIYSGGRLNRTSQLKAAIYLRGMQKVMEDMYLNPNVLKAILDKIVNFYLEFNKRLFEAANNKLDIFMMGDDFGMQDNMFFRKNKWEEFFKPGLKKYIDLTKKYDIKIMHHSCGSIEPLISDFIEMGLDILNPIQPEAKDMDPKILQKKYGNNIVFHGSISVQKTLPLGTPHDIEKEVKSRIDNLGSTGLILCSTHNLQTDIPIKNAETLFKAYSKFRNMI